MDLKLLLILFRQENELSREKLVSYVNKFEKKNELESQMTLIIKIKNSFKKLFLLLLPYY